jgi:hypothetical protein
MPRHRLGCGLVVGATVVLAACSRNRGRGDADASSSAASPVARPAVSSGDGGDTGIAAGAHWEWDAALDTALARQLTAPYQQPILTALNRDCTRDFGMIADARIQADLAFPADAGVTTVRALG